MMTEQDILLTLALDYAPILSPPAMTMYLCYYALRDKEGIVDVTYANLTEHLGKLTSSTISKYNEELKSVGLLESSNKEEGPTAYAPHRRQHIRVLQPTALTCKRRKELFGGKPSVESEIRKKVLVPEKLPLEYQCLLSKKDLHAALKKLKRARFTVGNLIEHFKLDKNRVRLWLSNYLFKTQVVKAMKTVVEEASRLEMQQELKEVTKGGKGRNIKTADEMYEMLMKSGTGKDGKSVPVDKWQPHQLLRYFCILFEKYNGGRKYTIMFPNGRNFSSKELRDITTMLRAFNNNSKEAAKYMEWVFENKENALEAGIFGTGILRTPGMINEYKKKASRPVVLRETDPIDEDYISWIKENVAGIYDQYDLDSMKDLFWLKQVYDEGDGTREVAQVIEEGIKRGIIPKEGNITLK